MVQGMKVVTKDGLSSALCEDNLLRLTSGSQSMVETFVTCATFY